MILTLSLLRRHGARMRTSLSVPYRARPVLGPWALLAILPFASACQGDHLTPPPPIDPAMLYWALDLNYHAVTLSTTAPYDTLTLTATPRNQVGEALEGLPAPQYSSTNPDQVVVTANGTLVAAQITTEPVAVVATLTTDNLKHVDTMFVRVVNAPTPAALGTFSIHPVPPDSAKHAVNNTADVNSGSAFSYLLNRLVHADTGGTPVSNVNVDFDPFAVFPILVPVPVTDLLVSFRSADTTVAKITRSSSGTGIHVFKLVGRQPSRVVTIYASTTVFGITKADTIAFRIGLPLFRYFGMIRPRLPDGLPSPNISFLPGTPPTLYMGVGGLVIFDTYGSAADGPVLNGTGALTFSDPTHTAIARTAVSYFGLTICLLFLDTCDDGPGDLPPTPGPWSRARVFTGPGTYDFQVTTPGTETLNGRIVVVDER